MSCVTPATVTRPRAFLDSTAQSLTWSDFRCLCTLREKLHDSFRTHWLLSMMAESLAEGASGHNHVYNIINIYIYIRNQLGVDRIWNYHYIPISDDFVWQFPYSIYSRMTTYIQTIVFTAINNTDLYSIISSSKLYYSERTTVSRKLTYQTWLFP